jgi:hypothetical protein
MHAIAGCDEAGESGPADRSGHWLLTGDGAQAGSEYKGRSQGGKARGSGENGLSGLDGDGVHGWKEKTATGIFWAFVIPQES